MKNTIPLQQFQEEGRNTIREVEVMKDNYKKVIDIITGQLDPQDVLRVFNYVMKEYPDIFLKAYDYVKNQPDETGYDLYLTWVGNQKIEVIKQVRAITGLGLKEAKDLVEATLPSLVLRGVTHDKVVRSCQTLINTGGNAVVVKKGEKPNAL